MILQVMRFQESLAQQLSDLWPDVRKQRPPRASFGGRSDKRSDVHEGTVPGWYSITHARY
jgi:hypothetical protein